MATTYYISNTGDDLNSGLSPGQAWASTLRIYSAPIVAGDSILFEGGHKFLANLYFAPPRVGRRDAPITLASYGNGKATLKAEGTLGIMIENGGGFVIRNLVLEGDGLETNNSYGLYVKSSMAQNQRFPFIYIDSVEVSGFTWGGIRLEVDPESDELLQSGWEDVRITHSSAHHNGDVGIMVQGRPLEQGYNHQQVYIADCVASYNLGVSSKSWGHTGSGILVGNSEGVMIERCVAFENGAKNRYPKGGPVGIWLWDCKNGVIQRCESHHNRTQTLDGGGFDLDGGCIACTMQYNYSHDNEGPGFMLAGYPGAKVLRQAVIRFNISQNDGRKRGYGAIYLWQASPDLLQGIQVYHNTCFQNTPSTGSPALFYVAAPGIKSVQVYNNLWISEGSPLMARIPADMEQELSMTHNAYFHLEGAPSFELAGQIYDDLDQWRKRTGLEGGLDSTLALLSDPLLPQAGQGENLTSPDSLHRLTCYQAPRQSPLLGQGLDLASLGIEVGPHDFFLRPIRPANARDIGAGVGLISPSVDALNFIPTANSYQPYLLPLGQSQWQVWGLPPGKFKFQLIDMQGKSMAKGDLDQAKQFSLDASLPQGTYWLRLEGTTKPLALSMYLSPD